MKDEVSHERLNALVDGELDRVEAGACSTVQRSRTGTAAGDCG
jgi:hypothetical protein